MCGYVVGACMGGGGGNRYYWFHQPASARSGFSVDVYTHLRSDILIS